MINPRIISQLETLENPLNLQTEYDMIGDIQNESSWCVSEAQNCQIDDLINFDEQMSLLKQLEVTEKPDNDFSNRFQDLNYENSLFPEKDAQESTKKSIQTKNSSTSLNINESNMDELSLFFNNHDYSKIIVSDQDEQLFKNNSHTCRKYEQNLDASFLIQEDTKDYMTKSFKIGLEGKDSFIKLSLHSFS